MGKVIIKFEGDQAAGKTITSDALRKLFKLYGVSVQPRNTEHGKWDNLELDIDEYTTEKLLFIGRIL